MVPCQATCPLGAGGSVGAVHGMAEWLTGGAGAEGSGRRWPGGYCPSSGAQHTGFFVICQAMKVDAGEYGG